jgi:peptidoglycan hydrolase-like protein with peptidoglycan-binding domain
VPCDNSSHELARSRARCGESIRPVLWRVSVCLLAAAVLALLGSAGSVKAQGDPAVAALQIALHARNLYGGPVDGIAGPQTASAVRRFQRKKRVPVTGVIGARTRLALGRLGRHRLGSRVLQPDAVGWDVSALQFLLAWHGFPSGLFDGRLGPHTGAAIRRFQRWAGLTVDGLVGPATLRALRVPPAISPILLRRPLNGRLGDGFGPRGRRFHAGVDLIAPRGTPVLSAGPGRVVWAGRRSGGWGLLVTIAHSTGVRSMYAHLSHLDVRLGQRLDAGVRIGRVGASGHATGPHLHFELRLRGAAIDPLTALR